MGVAHVVHTTLKTDTHHARTLTDRLEGRSQFDLGDMITLDLLLHDVLMELCEDLRRKDVLSEDTVKFFHTIFITYPQEFLGIACLGFLVHDSHVEDGVILVLPDAREDAIMAHLRKRNGMDGHHQRVVTLVLLDHLQGTGFVAVAAVECVAQEQQDRFVTRKLRCLVDRVAKAPFLPLVDIMQVFSDVQDARLLFLGLRIQFTEMFVGERFLEIVRILLTFLLRAQYQTNLLDTALDEFLEQDQNHRTHHAVGTRHREEILLQCAGGRVESRAKTRHRDDGLADRVYRFEGEGIRLQTLVVEVGHQFLLILLTARQELYRAIAMRAYALATPDHRLDGGILQYLVEFGRIECLRHRCHLCIEERLSLCHQTSQSLGIALRHALDGAIDQIEVFLTQCLMFRAFRITVREGIGLVKVREDLDGILLRTEVREDPVEMFLDIQRAHLDLIAIEGHEVGFDTEGTGLVETSTTAGRAQLTQVGDVHLAQRVEVEII